jgi:glucose-1-phosphate thymidylyltransferase
VITRAVILARGLGTRMRRPDTGAALSAEQASAADAGSKAMMPVAGERPFLDFVLSALADARIREVCLVVAPDHDAIEGYYTRNARPSRLHLHYAVQPEARGTADALLAARAFAGDHLFLMLNADNYYPVEAIRALAGLGAPGLIGFEREALVRMSNVDPERIRSFALVRTREEGRERQGRGARSEGREPQGAEAEDDRVLWLDDIVEKPGAEVFEAMGERALVSMNLWAFPAEIFAACERVTPSVRGELELVDGVRIAMQTMNVRFRVIPFAGGVLDLAGRGDVRSVAEQLRGVDVSL